MPWAWARPGCRDCRAAPPCVVPRRAQTQVQAQRSWRRLTRELLRSALCLCKTQDLEANARTDGADRGGAEADDAAAVQCASAATQADGLGVVVEAHVGPVVAQVGQLKGAAVPIDAGVRPRHP